MEHCGKVTLIIHSYRKLTEIAKPRDLSRSGGFVLRLRRSQYQSSRGALEASELPCEGRLDCCSFLNYAQALSTLDQSCDIHDDISRIGNISIHSTKEMEVQHHSKQKAIL